MDESTSSTTEKTWLSFLRTAREAFLIRRVNVNTTRNNTGATESAMRVNCQFSQNITATMPTRVSALMNVLRRLEVIKLWILSMSLVTLLIRSHVRPSS